jgi:type II secretory pathway predicted ATPase ExeA
MGKTSLLFQYLERLRSKARTAFVFQTDCDSRELLRLILSDLGFDSTRKDLSTMHDMLNQVLIEEMQLGRRFMLVVDEAQNLDDKSLEALRLLSNFETPCMKLMQIVIAGQMQLAERLARPSMEQLRQRISLFIQMRPLSAGETNAYIDHRLRVAGYSGPSLFTVGARSLIAEHSGGIPRKINNLCFNAMSLAYALHSEEIHSKMVREVISDLDVESMLPPQTESATRRSFVPPGSMLNPPDERRSWRIVPTMVALSMLLMLGAAFGMTWRHGERTQPPVLSAVQATSRTLDIASGEPPAEPIPFTTKPTPAPSFFCPPFVGTFAARPIQTVTVVRGATLRQLSLDYLGKFDVPTLLDICALNPEIADPNQIHAGQQLHLPLYLQ